MLTPENNSKDNIGNNKVLKKVMRQTSPFLLSLMYRFCILEILINGTTAKITMIPSVALGRSNNIGVAYKRVNITINVVVSEEIGL